MVPGGRSAASGPRRRPGPRPRHRSAHDADPADSATAPARPAWGCRLTQGLYVASGSAAVPLPPAKLWVAYPRLFEWPPLRSLRHALERLSVAVLVAGALFELGRPGC
ncbi:hypothetical protein GCM10010246_58530 [Streptomyces cuspidosporus]|uniref:Uncharacterized protein n=1 Tax=Streptomyces cuspidosporus TaxID=66882 RepID=A0ABN3GTH1_9ACTN